MIPESAFALFFDPLFLVPALIGSLIVLSLTKSVVQEAAMMRAYVKRRRSLARGPVNGRGI